MTTATQRNIWQDPNIRLAVREAAAPTKEGTLSRVVGLVLEARGVDACIGDLCKVRTKSSEKWLQAEVVGLQQDRTLLMPLGEVVGLEAGASVRRIAGNASVPVGEAMLGRVLDGLGQPIDNKGALRLHSNWPLHGYRRNPLLRKPIDQCLDVGVRAVDGLLTLGLGQRIGIFAGGGVGKSSLLGMMIREARADVVVVGLIGERNREVEEFVRHNLSTESRERTVIVAATSSEAPLVRARGALYSTSIAEYFRAQGKRVLLLMDSITRYAMALREIGLAIGEPPATKGYTPSVFSSLPRLLERAGTDEGEGSITGIYTVLVEGDDLADPISDAARAILDGHIILSRRLAERGHFPAIDIPKSISRLFDSLATNPQKVHARDARKLLATYEEAHDLLSIGAYQKGNIPELDTAIAMMPSLEKYLRQDLREGSPKQETLKLLGSLWEENA